MIFELGWSVSRDVDCSLVAIDFVSCLRADRSRRRSSAVRSEPHDLRANAKNAYSSVVVREIAVSFKRWTNCVAGSVRSFTVCSRAVRPVCVSALDELLLI